jgi:hypothetical protein
MQSEHPPLNIINALNHRRQFIGNLVEWYDFYAYSFLVVLCSVVFPQR